jgi:hypothetical protein
MGNCRRQYGTSEIPTQSFTPRHPSLPASFTPRRANPEKHAAKRLHHSHLPPFFICNPLKSKASPKIPAQNLQNTTARRRGSLSVYPRSFLRCRLPRHGTPHDSKPLPSLLGASSATGPASVPITRAEFQRQNRDGQRCSSVPRHCGSEKYSAPTRRDEKARNAGASTLYAGRGVSYCQKGRTPAWHESIAGKVIFDSNPMK